jgi:hypothetical protein
MLLMAGVRIICATRHTGFFLLVPHIKNKHRAGALYPCSVARPPGLTVAPARIGRLM